MLYLDESPDAELERCRRLKRLVHDLTAHELVMATADKHWSPRTIDNLEQVMDHGSAITWVANLR